VNSKWQTVRLAEMSDTDFNFESNRLFSFRLSHADFLVRNKEMMAIQGLHYFGPPDQVKCHFCKVVLAHWKPVDNPLADHRKFSNNCPLLQRRATNNVPISPEALDHILPPESIDECGFSMTIEDDNRKYQHANYQLTTVRLATYDLWPLSLKQRPQELADAGFFYTGMADRVICFCCGLGLCKWEEEDQPWEEHVKHKPDCEFVRMNLDDNEIKAIEQKVRDRSHEAVASALVISTPDVTDDSKMCKVCYEKPTDVALIPCGHVVCRQCAFILSDCPFCRRRVEKKLKLFFS
jgi:baculoviral IAP repeat-containing protein 7/8